MESDQCHKPILLLWYIALCFVVHCIVLRGTLHGALLYIALCLRYIALCLVVHCIVFCCALWYAYIALWFVVHCIVVRGRPTLHCDCGTLHCACDTLHCALW